VADRYDPRAEPGAAAARPAVVTLRGVRKAYNAGTPVEAEVLHGIDLDLLQGEFCAVMGPSGSGKSTLLNIIGLLDRPSSGTVTVCGEHTGELDDRSLTRLRGHSIGFVFQYHHLITAFSALENVMMPMLGAAGFADEAMRERAAMLIDSVGLRDRQHRPRLLRHRPANQRLQCGGLACAGAGLDEGLSTGGVCEVSKH
jgi:lipoprotein-releasing system ATP-binding protein